MITADAPNAINTTATIPIVTETAMLVASMDKGTMNIYRMVRQIHTLIV